MLLYKYLIRSYIGPLVATFFLMLLVFLMQAVFTYINELVGKGLSVITILKLLFYLSASLVPNALPLSILLSSIMTFGNFGERSELVAIKASGISLARVIRPLFLFMLLLSFLVYLFSNNVIPYSNYRWKNLLYNIRKKKPSLSLKQKVFNTDIEGYSIKIGRKYGENEELLEDVIIYEEDPRMGNRKVITAERGKMTFEPNSNLLLFTLYDGYSYEDMSEKRSRKQNKASVMPFVKMHFKEQVTHIDLTGFDDTDLEENKFSNNYSMLSIEELKPRIDTQRVRQKRFISNKRDDALPRSHLSILKKIDTATPYSTRTLDGTVVTIKKSTPRAISAYINSVSALIVDTAVISSDYQLERLKSSMKSNVSSIKNDIENYEKRMYDYNKWINRYVMEIHRKYALSFACLVLFFIGAPLGAIIRKGGLGLPMVFAISIFAVYESINVIAARTALNVSMDPIFARWLPSLIMLPFGILLTRQATTDSRVLSLDFYLKPAYIFLRKRKKKKQQQQTNKKHTNEQTKE